MPEVTSAPPAGAPVAPARPVVQPERGEVATAPRYRPEPQRGSYPAPQRWAGQQALQPQHRPMAGAAQPTAEPAALSQSSDYEHRLAAARTHFWQRDIGAAMQAYESLTTAYPDSAEAWGELGNVSFKLGRWSQAAEAYYRAVSLLIERGEAERARHLLRVLHGLDAGKAGELERRMRKPGG
jgi:tetratricopeptide (TPR) repeat protein